MRFPRTIAPLARAAAGSAAVLFGLASVLAIVPSISGERAAANDFVQDYVAVRAFADGQDPYTPTDELFASYLPGKPFYDQVSQPVPHPPALLVLLRPLAGMGLEGARAVWLALTAALYVLAVYALARVLGVGGFASAAVAIGVLAVPVVQKDLQYGQSNSLLLAAIVAGWILLRSERDRTAGIALGVAASLKLFPLLLVLPLLRKRRVRAAVGLIGSFAVVTATSGLFVGFQSTTTFVRDVTPANADYWAAAPMNLSLSAVPLRWFTDNPWIHGATLPTLAQAMSAGIILSLIVIAWRRSGIPGVDPVLGALPLMLLASPLTWDFSLPLLLPLLMMRVAASWVERRPPSPLWMISMAIVAIGIPVGLPQPSDAGVAAHLFGYAIPAYGLLAIAILAGRPIPSRTDPSHSAT